MAKEKKQKKTRSHHTGAMKAKLAEQLAAARKGAARRVEAAKEEAQKLRKKMREASKGGSGLFGTRNPEGVVEKSTGMTLKTIGTVAASAVAGGLGAGALPEVVGRSRNEGWLGVALNGITTLGLTIISHFALKNPTITGGVFAGGVMVTGNRIWMDKVSGVTDAAKVGVAYMAVKSGNTAQVQKLSGTMGDMNFSPYALMGEHAKSFSGLGRYFAEDGGSRAVSGVPGAAALAPSADMVRPSGYDPNFPVKYAGMGEYIPEGEPLHPAKQYGSGGFRY